MQAHGVLIALYNNFRPWHWQDTIVVAIVAGLLGMLIVFTRFRSPGAIGAFCGMMGGCGAAILLGDTYRQRMNFIGHAAILGLATGLIAGRSIQWDQFVDAFFFYNLWMEDPRASLGRLDRLSVLGRGAANDDKDHRHMQHYRGCGRDRALAAGRAR